MPTLAEQVLTEDALAFLTGGLLINYAPFMGIRRVMYLYHYLFALVFLVMLAAYCGGVLAGWNDDRDGSRCPEQCGLRWMEGIRPASAPPRDVPRGSRVIPASR
jgi:dolichyl-phosphate-mannose--protein O-mannosyl transferase